MVRKCAIVHSPAPKFIHDILYRQVYEVVCNACRLHKKICLVAGFFSTQFTLKLHNRTMKVCLLHDQSHILYSVMCDHTDLQIWYSLQVSITALNNQPDSIADLDVCLVGSVG